MFRRKGENLNRKGFICFVLKREIKNGDWVYPKQNYRKIESFVGMDLYIHICIYVDIPNFSPILDCSNYLDYLYGRNIGSFKDLLIIIIIAYLDITKITLKVYIHRGM